MLSFIFKKPFQRNVTFVLGTLSVLASGIWVIITYPNKASAQQLEPVTYNSGIAISGNANVSNFTQTVITNGAENSSQDTVYLSGPNNSTAIFMEQPIFGGKSVCSPFSNSKAKRLGEEIQQNVFTWVKVEILNGNCQGLQGWVSIENIKQA